MVFIVSSRLPRPGPLNWMTLDPGDPAIYLERHLLQFARETVCHGGGSKIPTVSRGYCIVVLSPTIPYNILINAYRSQMKAGTLVHTYLTVGLMALLCSYFPSLRMHAENSYTY